MKKNSYILRDITFKCVTQYKTKFGILMTHSLRIRDIVDTHLTHLFCNKEAHFRIVLLKTTHFRISYFAIRFNDYKKIFFER